jgi:transposase
VDGDGVPVACAVTASNVNETLAFERLFLAAFAVVARIRTVFADKSYDAERHRDLCRSFGAEPRIHKRGRPRGSGLGERRWTGSASSSSRCSRPPAYSWLRGGSRGSSES